MGAVRQNNMETKLWIILLTVTAMTSVTTQIDLSSMMGMGFGGKADKKQPPPSTPPPTQEYGQGYDQQGQYQQQPPKKDPFKFEDPFKKNKFESDKQDLKFDQKLEKEKDKFFKNDKQHKQQQYNDYNPVSVAAPIENPTYSTYIPSMNYAPNVDDGTYSSYGPPPQYHRQPQYNRGPYRGQGYNNVNVSAVAYDLYRNMYGYNNKGPAPQAPQYGQPSYPPNMPIYGPPPGQPPQYGQPPSPYGNVPYGHQGPPMGAPVVVPHDGGPYHGPNIDNYGQQQQPYNQYNQQQIDYSKYISPVPYAEVSEYLSPAQYNDYTGMLYTAYNVPTPPPPTPQYANNYTSQRGGYQTNNNEFKMVVAVVVLDGSHDYRSGYKRGTKDFGKHGSGSSSIQGTLFISEIYPYICLVSGVVTGLPANYKYGIAVHTFGDLTNGCVSIGPHFNPTKRTHGNINAPQSHAGDLGNLRSDGAGVAFVNKISRNQFSIQNRNPVAGRSIGICEKQDDLGLGGNIGSLRDGNCGQITACGIIGLANTGAPASNSGHY